MKDHLYPDGSAPVPFAASELDPTHMQMLVLRAAGLRPGQIAEITGYSPSRVSVVLNDPRAKAMIHRMAGDNIRQQLVDARELIQSYVGEAIETVAELMRDAESEPVRLGAAKDILDRGGFKPKEVVSNESVSIANEDARRILEALREARQPEPALDFVEDSAGVFRKVEDVTGA